MSGYDISLNETDLSKFAFAIKQILQGRQNNTGKFTIAANVATTTVTAPNCSTTSFVTFSPATANAATAYATTFILQANILNGSFIVSHANNAQTDRIFYYNATG